MDYIELKQSIIDQVGRPHARLVVLAALESFGIRNKDAKGDYGCFDLEALATKIYEDIDCISDAPVLNVEEKKVLCKAMKKRKTPTFISFVKNYGSSIILLGPILLQVLTIIIFGYSLWTYMKFNILQSTAVVLGVILGFIMSGGFVQLIGRQVFFYFNHRKYHKSREVINSFLLAGCKFFFLVILVLWILNLIFNLYSQFFVLVTFSYALMIGLLLLSISPFYPLKKRGFIFISIAMGTLVALSLFLFTSVSVYVTHFVGIGVSICINLLFLKVVFNKKLKETSWERRPNMILVAYRNYTYFLYGVFIYLFIFLDRILAWSANWSVKNTFILYEKDYEIGMDLAILMFFGLVGVMEFAIADFSNYIDLKHRNTSIFNRENLSKGVRHLYYRNVCLLFAMAIVSGLCIWAIVSQPWGYFDVFGEPVNELSGLVCILGGLAYFLLCWGMLNCLYMFTLNVSRPALRYLMQAMLVNFFVGILASRLISHEYSVLGLLAGSLYFVVTTTKQTQVFINELDYHYSAAY